MGAEEYTFNEKDLPQITFKLLTNILAECRVTNNLLAEHMAKGDKGKEDEILNSLADDRRKINEEIMKCLYPDHGELPQIS